MLHLPATIFMMCFMDTDWEQRQTARIGQAIKRLREKRSAQWLAEQATSRGVKMTRQSITDLENGRRRYITVAELTAIAEALDTSPLALLIGDQLMDGEIELLPGVAVTAGTAMLWFGGERSLYSDEPAIFFGNEPEEEKERRSAEYRSAMKYVEANYPLALVRRFQDAMDLIDDAPDAWNDTDDAGREIIKRVLKDALRDMRDSRKDMGNAGMIVESKEVRLTFDGEDG